MIHFLGLGTSGIYLGTLMEAALRIVISLAGKCRERGEILKKGRVTGLTRCMGPLAIVALGLAVVGCGEDERPAQTSPKIARQFGSELTGAEARDAAVVLRGYFEAQAEREWVRACGYLTKQVRTLVGRLAAGTDGVSGSDCSSYVAFSTQQLSSSERAAFDQVTVDSVRADGDRGFVLYRIPSDVERAMPIQSEGDRWKLAAFNGIPIAAS